MKISKQQLIDIIREEVASEGRLVGAGMAKSLTDQLNGLATSLQKFDPSSVSGRPADELRAAYIALQSSMDQVFGDSLENAPVGGSTPLEEGCGMTDEPMPFPGPPPEGGGEMEMAYDDHEGRMAKSQLFKMSKYSNELLQMLEDHEQLPSWVQAKVTKAADYLGAVKHYMEYEKASPKTHGVNEAFEMVLAKENVNVLIDMIKEEL